MFYYDVDNNAGMTELDQDDLMAQRPGTGGYPGFRPEPPPGPRPSNRPDFRPDFRPGFRPGPGFGPGPGHGPDRLPPPPRHDGPSSGMPPGPPPTMTPRQTPGLYAVDPGSIRGCVYRYAYIWLANGQSFWMYPTHVGRTSISGYRWTRFGWVYSGLDLNLIESFTCV